MGRRAQALHGSIYRRKGSTKLYVEYRKKKYSTGLDDTPQGNALAKQFLNRLHEQWLNQGFEEPIKRMSLHDAWSEYEKDHLAHKHKNTQVSYRYAYQKICGGTDVKLTAKSIQAAVQKYFNESEQSPAGRNVILRSFRVFCGWCAERKYIEKVSFKRLIVKTQKPIRTYNADEISSILEYYKSSSEKYYLLFMFLHLTGSRLTETLEIKSSQVLEDRIEMSNKIHKNEFDAIPISDQLRHILNRIKELNPSADLLFFWDREHARVIRKSFKRTCERLGIKHHGIHSIRKSFASNLIQHGVDLAHVKDLMRHKDVRTTLGHYHEFRISALKAVIEDMHRF